jgi:hypothetical protein
MVAAITTLQLLKTEIQDRIVALTPNSFTQHHYRIREEEARRSPLLEAGGPPRLFEFGKPVTSPDTENLYYGGGGGGIRNPAYIIPINLLYPTNEELWRIAAVDDYDQIRSDILNNRATEPANCEIRWIDPAGPEFDTSPADDWEVMTMFLRTVLTVQ